MANVRQVRAVKPDLKKRTAKKAKQRKPKQAVIPGMEDRKLESLHSAADAYLDAKEQARTASEGKKAAEATLVAKMKENGKTVYICDGLKIEVKPKDEGVSVKKQEPWEEETETSEAAGA